MSDSAMMHKQRSRGVLALFGSLLLILLLSGPVFGATCTVDTDADEFDAPGTNNDC